MASALLFTTFGTSHAHARAKTIDAIEERLIAEFPQRAPYSAWTSERIVARVRSERGERHDTLDEAFARLESDGVDDVIVATTCLVPGHEMRKVEEAATRWAQGSGRTARVAAALLTTPDDCRALAKVVCGEFSEIPSDEALLLMGHGALGGGSNYVYAQVRDAFTQLGRPLFFVATVEGKPAFDEVLVEVESSGVRCVHLAPLMIVAGGHAALDLAGDANGSWQSALRARGYRTQAHLRGLGEYPGVQQMICDHARNARLLGPAI